MCMLCDFCLQSYGRESGREFGDSLCTSYIYARQMIAGAVQARTLVQNSARVRVDFLLDPLDWQRGRFAGRRVGYPGRRKRRLEPFLRTCRRVPRWLAGEWCVCQPFFRSRRNIVWIPAAENARPGTNASPPRENRRLDTDASREGAYHTTFSPFKVL